MKNKDTNQIFYPKVILLKKWENKTKELDFERLFILNDLESDSLKKSLNNNLHCWIYSPFVSIDALYYSTKFKCLSHKIYVSHFPERKTNLGFYFHLSLSDLHIRYLRGEIFWLLVIFYLWGFLKFPSDQGTFCENFNLYNNFCFPFPKCATFKIYSLTIINNY